MVEMVEHENFTHLACRSPTPHHLVRHNVLDFGPLYFAHLPTHRLSTRWARALLLSLIGSRSIGSTMGPCAQCARRAPPGANISAHTRADAHASSCNAIWPPPPGYFTGATGANIRARGEEEEKRGEKRRRTLRDPSPEKKETLACGSETALAYGSDGRSSNLIIRDCPTQWDLDDIWKDSSGHWRVGPPGSSDAVLGLEEIAAWVTLRAFEQLGDRRAPKIRAELEVDMDKKDEEKEDKKGNAEDRDDIGSRAWAEDLSFVCGVCGIGCEPPCSDPTPEFDGVETGEKHLELMQQQHRHQQHWDRTSRWRLGVDAAAPAPAPPAAALLVPPAPEVPSPQTPEGMTTPQ